MGVFWNRQDLLWMMGTEIFKTDAPWAEKLRKTRVQFLMAPTVFMQQFNIEYVCAHLVYML